MGPILITNIVNILVMILVIGLLIPLARGKVKRNVLYGFRLKNAMKNDSNWYVINAMCAKLAIKFSIIPFTFIVISLIVDNILTVWVWPIVLLSYVAIFSYKSYKIDKSFAAQQGDAPEPASPAR